MLVSRFLTASESWTEPGVCKPLYKPGFRAPGLQNQSCTGARKKLRDLDIQEAQICLADQPQFGELSRQDWEIIKIFPGSMDSTWTFSSKSKGYGFEAKKNLIPMVFWVIYKCTSWGTQQQDGQSIKQVTVVHSQLKRSWKDQYFVDNVQNYFCLSIKKYNFSVFTMLFCTFMNNYLSLKDLIIELTESSICH